MKFEKEGNWTDVPRYDKHTVRWHPISQGKLVYSAAVDGASWILRMNDFPDEPLYTLLIDDREIINLTEWPKNWDK